MSRTIDGTAVAMIVESMATSPVDSMTAMSTGPRAERNPTLLPDTFGTSPGRADGPAGSSDRNDVPAGRDLGPLPRGQDHAPTARTSPGQVVAGVPGRSLRV